MLSWQNLGELDANNSCLFPVAMEAVKGDCLSALLDFAWTNSPSSRIICNLQSPCDLRFISGLCSGCSSRGVIACASMGWSRCATSRKER